MARCLIIACLALLVGCSTPGERAARAQAEVDEMIQVYGPACERLGYKPDEDKWRECIIRLSSKDELRYRNYTTTTTCFGHRGFFNCSSF